MHAFYVRGFSNEIHLLHNNNKDTPKHTSHYWTCVWASNSVGLSLLFFLEFPKIFSHNSFDFILLFSLYSHKCNINVLKENFFTL